MSDDENENEKLAPPSAAQVMAARDAKGAGAPETTEADPAPEKAVAPRATRKH